MTRRDLFLPWIVLGRRSDEPGTQSVIALRDAHRAYKTYQEEKLEEEASQLPSRRMTGRRYSRRSRGMSQTPKRIRPEKRQWSG